MCQISSRQHQPFRRYNSGNTPLGHKIRPAGSSSNATRPKVNPRQQATTPHPCTKNRRNRAYRSGHTAPKVPPKHQKCHLQCQVQTPGGPKSNLSVRPPPPTHVPKIVVLAPSVHEIQRPTSPATEKFPPASKPYLHTCR